MVHAPIKMDGRKFGDRYLVTLTPKPVEPVVNLFCLLAGKALHIVVSYNPGLVGGIKGPLGNTEVGLASPIVGVIRIAALQGEKNSQGLFKLLHVTPPERRGAPVKMPLIG
jgi:hypothetical protein